MNEIKILPPSEWKEGKQGAFRLPEKLYRPAKGISQSSLKHVLRSPACVAYSKRFPMEPTWPMQLGTLAHAAILERETFEKTFWIQPETYEAEDSRTKKEKSDGVPYIAEIKPWNANANVCKEWIRNHTDRPNLSRAEFQSILDMRTQFEAPDESGEPGLGSMFLKNGSGEVAFFHVDEETGILLKGKLDLFALGSKECLIGDLKIMGDADEFTFSQQCADLNLHFQSAFYISLVRAELERAGVTGLQIRFLHATIESKKPYFVGWMELDEEALFEGRKLFRRALSEWAQANETGHFSTIKKVSLPKWKLAKDA